MIGPSVMHISKRNIEKKDTLEDLGVVWSIINNNNNNTKTLITYKCTKRVLSSMLTHSYMFLYCVLEAC
jgi:hypothetical protein